ncbi:MAG TPA: response regulator [Candidatus Omnitrophota bacterium]|nr:response regulator [Candidatus Omnitrophota bacterium]HPD84985.1 response regulator [Candidatus Omnitrophota bacterium]HRZ03843.1 response regulator [Candidatus Omnitrophota bacterium]
MAKAKKILVIDDEPDLISVLQGRLESEGYKVVAASDGEEGLKKLATENPDLIILDLMLPGIGGYEFCAKVKADEKFMHIPVLMLTARAGDVDKAMGFKCGADGYLTKPFSGEALLEEISELLRD